MSRLDSFIRRMTAQRDCIDRGAEMIEALAGCVLELGLGNGRTYDHLRLRLPNRDIYVLDRRIRAHPDCIPDQAHLFLGEFDDTLPAAAARLGRAAALAHCDFGSGDAARDRPIAVAVAAALPSLVVAGGVALSDQALVSPRLAPAPLPPGVAEGRYHIYVMAE